MRTCEVLLTTILILSMIGCAPAIKRSGYLSGGHDSGVASPRDCNVRFQRDVPVLPEDGVIIGTMKIGDSGFSINCGEDDVLALLRKEACRIGADVIVLRNIHQPDLISSCYRVTADFVRLNENNAEGARADKKQSSADDVYYNDQEVKQRVRKSSEMQACLGVGSVVVGFILGYTLFSPK